MRPSTLGCALALGAALSSASTVISNLKATASSVAPATYPSTATYFNVEVINSGITNPATPLFVGTQDSSAFVALYERATVMAREPSTGKIYSPLDKSIPRKYMSISGGSGPMGWSAQLSGTDQWMIADIPQMGKPMTFRLGNQKSTNNNMTFWTADRTNVCADQNIYYQNASPSAGRSSCPNVHFNSTMRALKTQSTAGMLKWTLTVQNTGDKIVDGVGVVIPPEDGFATMEMYDDGQSIFTMEDGKYGPGKVITLGQLGFLTGRTDGTGTANSTVMVLEQPVYGAGQQSLNCIITPDTLLLQCGDIKGRGFWVPSGAVWMKEGYGAWQVRWGGTECAAGGWIRAQLVGKKH